MDWLNGFLADTFRSAGPMQLAIIGIAALIVVAGVVLGRRWYLNRPDGGARLIVADALAVISPYLVGLAIIGVARPRAPRRGRRGERRTGGRVSILRVALAQRAAATDRAANLEGCLEAMAPSRGRRCGAGGVPGARPRSLHGVAGVSR
jgi:hypothetical protein